MDEEPQQFEDEGSGGIVGYDENQVATDRVYNEDSDLVQHNEHEPSTAVQVMEGVIEEQREDED